MWIFLKVRKKKLCFFLVKRLDYGVYLWPWEEACNCKLLRTFHSIVLSFKIGSVLHPARSPPPCLTHHRNNPIHLRTY